MRGCRRQTRPRCPLPIATPAAPPFALRMDLSTSRGRQHRQQPESRPSEKSGIPCCPRANIPGSNSSAMACLRTVRAHPCRRRISNNDSVQSSCQEGRRSRGSGGTFDRREKQKNLQQHKTNPLIVDAGRTRGSGVSAGPRHRHGGVRGRDGRHQVLQGPRAHCCLQHKPLAFGCSRCGQFPFRTAAARHLGEIAAQPPWKSSMSTSDCARISGVHPSSPTSIPMCSSRSCPTLR